MNGSFMTPRGVQSASNSTLEALWTAEDVACFLNVSVSMVYKLRRQGALPFIRVGTLYRFHPPTIRALAGGEVTPPRRLR